MMSQVIGAELNRRIARTTTIVIAALAVVTVPQLVMRAVSYEDARTVIPVTIVVAALSLLATYCALRLVAVRAPRKASHQLVARYIGTRAGLVCAAAHILAYTLVVILGGELVITSLSAVVDLPSPRLFEAVLIMLLAFPVMVGRIRPHLTIALTIAVVALTGLVVIIAAGLIVEVINGIDVKEISLARWDALNTHIAFGGRYHPYIEAAVCGSMLSAVVYMGAHRVSAYGRDRRADMRGMLLGFVPAFLLVALTLYFVLKLQMPGRRIGIPSLSMAYAFLGSTAQIVCVVLYVALGVASAYVSLRQLPRLLRELALDGLLPRHLAAEDAYRPRRVIVGLIAILAGIVTLALNSTRSIGTLFVFTIVVQAGIASVAMVQRSRSILNESTHAEERGDAVRMAWIFRLYTVGALVIMALIVYAQPLWVLAGLAALAVPVIFLMAHARGMGRVNEVLAADTSATTVLPTRVHGIVLIDNVDQPTVRAVTYARALRMSSLTAVCVDTDPTRTASIRRLWRAARIPVALTVLGEPHGAIRGPIIEYVRSRVAAQPGDIMNVFIPRVMSSGSWDRFFISHTTPRVVSDLRNEDHVIVTEVPFAFGMEDPDAPHPSKQ